MSPLKDISYIINELAEDRESYFNAIAPPIMQSSNFAFKSIAALRTAFEDEMGGYLYSRGLNPTGDILRKKLAALDQAEDCLVFGSGAAAIFAGVLANVKAGDHIVSVKSPYTWAQKMFDVILPRFGITTTYVDGTDTKNFEAALKPYTTLIYLESPNSWTFAIQDLKEVVALAKAHNIVTMIDNSYCTPIYQRPIALGIDLSMQTATKYISGHSDTLGGVLSGSHIMIKKIFDSEYLNVGSGISPFNAWLLLRGLRTLPARLERITVTTKKVLEFLKTHPKIDKVLFPLDASFPQYQLARTQMDGACGLMTITLKNGTMESITRFCESLRHFFIAVSWGGHESLVIPKCAGLLPGDFDKDNIEHQYIRIYTGLEEPTYLIDDLNQALNGI
ncbi:trans-sulfuration enzyme family protein [Flavisolibacter ginsengisoli]|jgi:cystathionine beta-lyase/cystathionine gamma-synthase|uniref:Cystathionine beta-lyase/cystathionine gamma-synthase n=1 Tax=Flavisolibacter ginsengisoli DSM 18119 TaxID=1121884 RepID=A0A1M4VUP6_9BACT|nr:aminotransferase class I/II-fold pyridoxal phosphate-dependent enzyme [Flavisolibacter ginsengisoli]SHE72640.1 Cystathionine beta-lyase/cystathionine gamma-synthase [Flavisolibacter ginsengisoli DSM 18119]